MKTIEERIFDIEERNRRVELDKAWEVSWVRRGLILVITYAVVVLILGRIHPEGAFIDAVIPCLGYLLSTLSLPMIRHLWVERRTDDNTLNNSEEDL
jgi:hypothetical protein